MKVIKNNRPYYAKWWFFFSLITLGWITPITKHWDLFLFGDSAKAIPLTTYSRSLLRFHQFAFRVNGYYYVSSYSLEQGRNERKDSITIFYDKNNPDDYITFDFKKMYSNQHLFFPVGLQIGLGVFFLLIKFKEL